MLTDCIRNFLDRHHMSGGRMVAACSGGADSTALLLVLHDLRRFTLICGHVNHHLRGAESDADEAFVRDLCERLAVPFRVANGTVPEGLIRAHGVEAAARQVRNALLHQIEGDFIATAHQKNDQAETILMRMITGTGLAGLRGIHEVRQDRVIRPMLGATRSEVEAFLAERGIAPRRDSSNRDPRFLRNRVRQTLAGYGPAAVESLAAIAAQAQRLWPSIEQQLDRLDRESTRASDHATHFDRWPEDPWWRQALLHRHIRRLDSSREISSADLQRLASSLDAIRRVSVTKNLELVRRNDHLVLTRRSEPAAKFELAVPADSETHIPEINAVVRIQSRTRNPKSKIGFFQLPHDSPAHFVLRNRRNGDRFQPLGMDRDKKLKDFLIDRKIPAERRDSIPLLVWNDQIVWVGGVEISERFKVTSPGAGALYEVTVESREDHEEFQR
jgi:tRNA(Ile)-lysidine synthase